MNTLKSKLITGIVSSALLAGCLGGVTGCGATDRSGRDMNIELINPVGTAESSVVASYRSIYNSESYSAMVLPKVVEYSYDSSVAFYKYGCVPGDKVNSGDCLIQGNTDNLDEQIKNLRKTIKKMEEDYQEKSADLSTKLAEDESELDYTEYVLSNWEKQKPEKNDMQDDEYQEELDKWQKTYDEWSAKKGGAWIAVEKTKQAIKETNELYNLDHNYQLSCLNRLISNRNNLLLATDMTGYVVANQYFSPGEYISGGVSAAAVGDFDVKEIRCEFINSGVIGKAESVYAIFDGVRYEVEYQAIDSAEYDRQKELNGTVYSTFLVDDAEDAIQIGDYGVIVVVNDIRDNVLCVPKSAIGSDESGNFVYKFNGSTYEVTYIKTGINDGVYTEVLSGIADGDIIKSSMIVTAGTNEATLTYGNVCSTFSETGYLYYTSSLNVENTIQYGIVYLDEVCVSQYEQVSKGQTLVKVHVTPDVIEIGRQERILLRQNEKLQKLIDEDKDRADADKKNTKAIAQTQEYIEELKALISDMKIDGSTTEIVSPVDGIVNNVINVKAGELLGNGRWIATISDQNQVFITVSDNNNLLTYGNKVEVAYKDNQGNARVAEGTVVSVNNMALSKKLQTDYALVQIPAADISMMAGSNRNSEGRWGRQSYKVTATIRSIDNVLLIPRKAVKVGDKSAFVTVKDENGILRRVSFVIGGSDGNNYWAAEGLSEGMVVCWE